MTLNDDIKKGLEKGIILLGQSVVLKHLKQGKLSKIVLAHNAPIKLKKEIVPLCDLSGVECQELKRDSADLGAACRRSHSVSVLGFLK